MRQVSGKTQTATLLSPKTAAAETPILMYAAPNFCSLLVYEPCYMTAEKRGAERMMAKQN